MAWQANDERTASAAVLARLLLGAWVVSIAQRCLDNRVVWVVCVSA
ncbi:MAG TPA: hypothetical protein VMV29_15305 [Ktedonobacterales bacterium]|nr:hypothetical protein [Ktedonobacterales bacterium]